MEIRIIAIGRRMPRWVADGVADFTGRMPRHLPVRLVERPASRARQAGDVDRARREEGETLLEAARGMRVIALHEGGRMLATRDLAGRLDDWMMAGDDVALLVGGADGLDRRVLDAADLAWSLSALTFPHMLVRVILAEQLYRAWSVLENHPYHRA